MARKASAKYAALGRVIQREREAKGYTRRNLAEMVHYEGENGAITIAKIERGEMRPGDERLTELIEVLGLPTAEVERLSRRPTGNPFAVAHDRQANRRRIESLNARTSALAADVERYYAPLEESRTRIEQKFLGPFLDFASSLRGSDKDLQDALTVVQSTNSRDLDPSDLKDRIELNRDNIAGSLAGVLAGTTGGALGGVALGGAGAFATYSAVAALASASTGTAITALSGVAATNATLAALGGGSLAAGGLGIAGGTAVLAGIVAMPALVGAGVALIYTSRRWDLKQKDESARIHFAEREFTRVEGCLRASFPWTDDARNYLLVAEMAADRLLPLIEIPEPIQIAPIEWTSLTEARREAVRLGIQLTAVMLTVLPLPAVATPDEGADAAEVAKMTEEWNSSVLADAKLLTEAMFAQIVLLTGNTSLQRRDRSLDT